MLDVIRFYNGQSSPFQQKFVYTKPDTDFKEEYGNAYWNVDAPPQNFFEVPFEVETGGGTWRISIHKEITERFGDRGIIRVDANAKKAFEANPTDARFAFVAVDDEGAKEKGAALWRAYLRRIIDGFEDENARRVTERGITPLRPNNFVSHAYKELGLEIPGDDRFIKAGLQQTEVTQLRDSVNTQQRMIEEQREQIAVLLQLVKPAVAQAEGADKEPAAAGNSTKTHKK